MAYKNMISHHYKREVCGIMVYYFILKGWSEKYMTLSSRLYKQIIKDGFIEL